MRKLKADEIECRVSQISEKGCSLLLYKTARVDRAILDEEFGQYSWQNDFKVIDGKMYGGIGIYSNDLSEWIWKWDCGTESNTEAEKGQASDCFKRAGFKWGIGVELYSAPFIFVQVETVKNTNGKYALKNKFQKFEVKEIGYADNGDINKLKIVDDKNKIVFEMGKYTKPEPKKQEPKQELAQSLEEYKTDMDLITTLKDLQTYASGIKQLINSNKELNKIYWDRYEELKADEDKGAA